MDIVNSLNHLQLHLLGDEWVQQVWDNDFMEMEELPNEYEEFLMENDVLNIFEIIVSLLRGSFEQYSEDSDELSESNSASEVSWELLMENRIEHRHLLSLVAYFIGNGQNKPDDMKSLQLCFKASSLYFLLLAIPGCDAFFVFQPSIYEKSLKTLCVYGKLNETKSNRQSRGQKQTSDDDSDGDNEDGIEVSFDSLNAQTKVHIRKCLNVILKDQLFMMKRYPLKIEDTLEKTIIQLISLTQCATCLSTSDFDKVKVNGDTSTFISNCFVLLNTLCIPLHGKRDETVRLILYHLIPNVLMAGEFVKGMTTHNLNVVRLQTEKFVLYLLKCLGKDAHQGICVFVQHLCARVTDKADYRLKVSQSIVSILNVLPSEPYFHTIKWLLQYAHDMKASHRLFALEVISKLLYEEERQNDTIEKKDSFSPQPTVSSSNEGRNRDDDSGNDDNNVSNGELDQSHEALHNSTAEDILLERDMASHKYLLGVLFSRCHDRSGTVRTKALSTLSDCLKSNNELIVKLMKEIFVTPYEDNDLIENDSIIERGFLNTKIFLNSLDKPQHLQADPLPGGKAVVNEMLNLVEDDKVFVRKNAFTFLECIMKMNRKWLNEKLLKVMCEHVRDPALLIKKQLIQSLTDLLLLYPDNTSLATHYIDAVLPQISHSELKVQEKVLDVLQSTILQQLVPFEKLNTTLSYLPWKLLEIIINLKKRKFFQLACSMWSKNNAFRKDLVSLIQSHVNTQHNVAAWLFLSCVAAYIKIKDPHFIVEYYRRNLTNPDKAARYAVVKALDVLGTAWKYLPRDEQSSICAELLESVQQKQLSTTLIGPVLDVVHLITFGQASSTKEGQEAVMAWSNQILEKLDEYFQQHSPCQSDNTRLNMEEFMRNLVTLGDVAQLCPGKVPVSIAIILTGILFPEKLHDPVKWSHAGLQALTVVTLGKMCLQNECLAKRIIPALGLLLAESKHEAVKVNVMNTLSDMCIRFTAVVEPLLPEMCLCLKDSNAVVRHHTITVFVRLLQQDFLKLRGALLFHMMSMLVDPTHNIAQLANYFMTQCVITRNKSIMYQNIVESIFFYNKYETHPSYSKVKLSPQESHLFNMAGSGNITKRQTLYRFMCEHMTDEQRMQSIHKICVDVLGGVANEIVTLDEKGESVLRDAFFILSCEEICLHSLRTQSEDEPATDDAERVTAAVNTAKKNIISQCVKKQVVEIIIPIIMQLKGKLQSSMSPLLPSLMSYLRNILKDHKNEIEDIFAEDKTLAEEILFDMKRFEEEERNLIQSQESDEDDGEVDHMRPLLVELATDHLRKSIRRGSSRSQNQIVASPGSNEQLLNSPEGDLANRKSPQNSCTEENEPATSGSNYLEARSPEQSCHNIQQSSQCARISSAEETSGSYTRSRSRTPTRSSSRNSLKRGIDEVNECFFDSDNPIPSTSRGITTIMEVTQRRSSRTLSSTSKTNSPLIAGNRSTSMDVEEHVNETESMNGNQKQKGKQTFDRNMKTASAKNSLGRKVNSGVKSKRKVSSEESDSSPEESVSSTEDESSVVQKNLKSNQINEKKNEGNAVRKNNRGGKSSRKRSSFELFL